MALYTFNNFTFQVREMSRKSQLECAVQFRAWLETAGALTELERVAFISTLIMLHTPLEVQDSTGKLSPGKHDLGDSYTLTLPITVECLDNDLPTSLTGWLLNAAAEENAYVLEGFLAGVTRIGQKQPA